MAQQRSRREQRKEGLGDLMSSKQKKCLFVQGGFCLLTGQGVELSILVSTLSVLLHKYKTSFVVNILVASSDKDS